MKMAVHFKFVKFNPSPILSTSSSISFSRLSSSSWPMTKRLRLFQNQSTLTPRTLRRPLVLAKSMSTNHCNKFSAVHPTVYDKSNDNSNSNSNDNKSKNENTSTLNTCDSKSYRSHSVLQNHCNKNNNIHSLRPATVLQSYCQRVGVKKPRSECIIGSSSYFNSISNPKSTNNDDNNNNNLNAAIISNIINIMNLNAVARLSSRSLMSMSVRNFSHSSKVYRRFRNANTNNRTNDTLSNYESEIKRDSLLSSSSLQSSLETNTNNGDEGFSEVRRLDRSLRAVDGDVESVNEENGSRHEIGMERSVDNSKDLPDMSRSVFNLAPYVGKSKTLQNLVSLGVNLTKVEKVRGIASLLLMSDFDTDILPYLRYLAQVGVAPDKLGYVITLNPLVLTEYIEDLEHRVGYLVSKGFTVEEVGSMYTRAPIMVSMDALRLDNKLGFLQQTFSLSGEEVKQVALTFPRLLTWRQEKIANIHNQLEEFLGFEADELKHMILVEPKLFTTDIHKINKNFDYLHNVMGIRHSHLTKWPAVLRCRLHALKTRHSYLVHLHKAQYNPNEPLYVSTRSLVACNDSVFCQDVANTSEEDFYNFLKTM